MTRLLIIFSLLIFKNHLIAQKNLSIIGKTEKPYQGLETKKYYAVHTFSQRVNEKITFKVNDQEVAYPTYYKYAHTRENISKCRPCILETYDINEVLVSKGLQYEDCSIGFRIEYYPIGTIKTVGHYKHNRTNNRKDLSSNGGCSKNGRFLYFNQKGELIRREFWKSGKLVDQENSFSNNLLSEEELRIDSIYLESAISSLTFSAIELTSTTNTDTIFNNTFYDGKIQLDSLKILKEFKNTFKHIDHILPYQDSLFIVIGTYREGDYYCDPEGYFLHQIEIYSMNGLLKKLPCYPLQFFADNAVVINDYLFIVSEFMYFPTHIVRIDLINEEIKPLKFYDFNKKKQEDYSYNVPRDLFVKNDKVYAVYTPYEIYEIIDWNQSNPKIANTKTLKIPKKLEIQISNPLSYHNGVLGLGYSGGIFFAKNKKTYNIIYTEEDTAQTTWDIEVQNDSTFYALKNNYLMKFKNTSITRELEIPKNKNDYIENFCILNNRIIVAGNKSMIILNTVEEKNTTPNNGYK